MEKPEDTVKLKTGLPLYCEGVFFTEPFQDIISEALLFVQWQL